MSDTLLSEQELDTLLQGVERGDVDLDRSSEAREAEAFDFAQEHNILVSKLPKLGTLNDRLVRSLEHRLNQAYKCEVEVRLAFLHTSRFTDVRSTLAAPMNMNIATVNPGGVTGMVMLDPKLLYILVDHYFGGSGDLAGRQPTSAFSPIELKMSEQFLDHFTAEWERAWDQISPLKLIVTSREDNPKMVQQISPNEVVFQAVYQVGFNGNFGEAHVVIPYSVIEGMRDVLGLDGPPADGKADAAWHTRLSEEVGVARVGISAEIDGVSMSLSKLLQLKAGDVVPIEMPETICLSVEGVPVFEGQFGACSGHNAIKITQSWSHTRPRKYYSKL